MRRGALDPASVLEHCVSLDADRDHLALVAPADAGQSRPITDATNRLATTIAQVATDTDRDVLVDLGRVAATAGSPWLNHLSALLLVVEPSLRGASAARSALGRLPGSLPDGCALRALIAGHGPYGPAEISEALDVGVVGTIANDPASARVLTGETPAGRGFDRSPLMRSARSLTNTLAQTLPPQRALYVHPSAGRSDDPVAVGESA